MRFLPRRVIDRLTVYACIACASIMAALSWLIWGDL